jgi:hypothetical protein
MRAKRKRKKSTARSKEERTDGREISVRRWCSVVLCCSLRPHARSARLLPIRAFAQWWSVCERVHQSADAQLVAFFLAFLHLLGTLPQVDQSAHILLEKSITSD